MILAAIIRSHMQDDSVTNTHTVSSGSGQGRVNYSIIYAIIAIIIIAGVLVGQITGPSDIADQDQPRTMSYTTNIVNHPENWVLPKQHNTFSATKPPLYNWIAAPFVAITDGKNITAHKSPSVIGFAAICLLLWWVGNRIDKGGFTGLFAVIAFSTNYTWYKLAYLARPDAILNLWVILGFIIVTAVYVDCSERERLDDGFESDDLNRKYSSRFRQAFIWISAALAILAKGPAGLLIPVYAVLLSWFVASAGLQQAGPDNGKLKLFERVISLVKYLIGRTKYAVRFSGALWGLPLLILIVGVWVLLAYRADPEHVSSVLIQKETMRRIPGVGETTSDYGQWYWLRTSMNMPFYFIARFLPWSIFFFAALIDLFGRKSSDSDKVRGMPRSSQYNPSAHVWLKGSIIFTFLVIVFFSPVGGKRADYIASAYASASLVVGWWFTHLGYQIGRKRPWIVFMLAVITLSGIIIYDNTLGLNAKNKVSNVCESFAWRARLIIDRDSESKMPVEFYGLGGMPLQSLMSMSQPDLLMPVNSMSQSDFVDNMNELLLSRTEPFWLIVQSWSLRSVFSFEGAKKWHFTEEYRSAAAPGRPGGPPYEIVLLRATIDIKNH